MFSRYTKEIQV